MIKNILWDFDGVILDSMKIRDYGFREIFKHFEKEKVEELINYHRINGGLSRYVKIRFFYEEILSRRISESEVNQYADKFSVIMKEKLVDPQNLIQDSVTYIKENYKKYKFHIVSGSDQVELRFLCKALELSDYFLTIYGSPTPKKLLVANVLNEFNYDIKETILIGDSINDFEAASVNNISFSGYNNIDLKDKGEYIDKFIH